MTEPVRSVLSFGAGVQTTALAILQAVGRIERADAIVFADTGDEAPETYAHLERFDEWLAPYGMRVERVLRNPTKDLIQYYSLLYTIPVRYSRSCTANFKIGPIRRWLRKHGHENTDGRSKLKPRMQLGISWDEMTRMRTSDVQWIVNEYPLIDARMNREDCQQVIKEHLTWTVPKSGCMCCPFRSLNNMVNLVRHHPDRMERVMQMEEQCLEKHPGLFLSSDGGFTIREAVRAFESQMTLFDLDEADCGRGGYCHA